MESMSKSGVQFLATRQEVVKMIEELCTNVEVTIATGGIESPNNLSVLRKGETLPGDCGSYVYIKLGSVFEKSNSLFIYMGQYTDEYITESSIGIKGEGDEFDYWKKQISKLRNSFLKGAYVVNPYRDSKTYYKNIYYTKGAKAAFEQGIKMKPVAGWNYYLLVEEQG